METVPPRREALVSVISVGLAVALSLFGDMAMYVILPVQYASMGLTAFQVGVLLSANRWVRLLTNRVAEVLVRRHGTRILFPLSLAAGSAIAAGYALTSSFAILLALRMAWGFCWSIIRHTGVMTTASVGGAGRTSRLMGLYAGLVQAGFVAGTFAAGILFDRGGLSLVFLMAAAMSLAALPAAALPGRRLAPSAGSSGGGNRPSKRRTRTRILPALRGAVIAFVGTGLIISTLGYLLRQAYGESVDVGALAIGVTTLNGLLLAAQYLINGVGAPLLGIAVDRHGVRAAQIVGFVVSGLSLLALGLAPGVAILVPLVALFFTASAVSRIAVEVQAASAGPRAYSELATAMDFGAAAGPLLGWVGIELSQSDAVFWVGGGLFALAACSFLADKR